MLYLSNTLNLNHKVRECKTLNLYYGACNYRDTKKYFISAFDCGCKGAFHISYKKCLINYIIHICSILCKHLPYVGIRLTHLSLHISFAYHIAIIVMAYLP